MFKHNKVSNCYLTKHAKKCSFSGIFCCCLIISFYQHACDSRRLPIKRERDLKREHFKHTAHKVYCTFIWQCLFYGFCNVQGSETFNFFLQFDECSASFHSEWIIAYCCAKKHIHMRCMRLANRLHHHLHHLSSQRRDLQWNSMYAHHLRQSDRQIRIHAHKSAFFVSSSSLSQFIPQQFFLHFGFITHWLSKEAFFFISPRHSQSKNSNNKNNSKPKKTFTITRFIFRISNDFLQQR